MKVSMPVFAIPAVIVLTIAAAAYRVSTAPDRMRLRLDSARTTCVNAGGEWVKVGNEETCRIGDSAKKV